MREGGERMEFKDLRVWREAKDLVLEIYRITEQFPKVETYGLADQLRRATNSVCANIAEGFNRYHAKDKIKFYYNARGSISESQSHLIIASELGYLEEVFTYKLIEDFNRVRKMLNAMINSVNRCHESRSK